MRHARTVQVVLNESNPLADDKQIAVLGRPLISLVWVVGIVDLEPVCLRPSWMNTNFVRHCFSDVEKHISVVMNAHIFPYAWLRLVK